jgi:aldehyde dehydrogenase (NAD+)
MTNPINISKTLASLGIEASNPGAAIGGKWIATKGKQISSFSPVDGKVIANVTLAEEDAYEKVVESAQDAFKS